MNVYMYRMYLKGACIVCNRGMIISFDSLSLLFELSLCRLVLSRRKKCQLHKKKTKQKTNKTPPKNKQTKTPDIQKQKKNKLRKTCEKKTNTLFMVFTEG